MILISGCISLSYNVFGNFVGSISHKDLVAAGGAFTVNNIDHLQQQQQLGLDIEHCRHPDRRKATWRLLRRLLTEHEISHQKRIHRIDNNDEEIDGDSSDLLSAGQISALLYLFV